MSVRPKDRPGVFRQSSRWVRHVRHVYGREAVKLVLGRMLRWQPLKDPVDGWSIVLGTPWALRHLLEVNLRFVSRCDLTGLEELFVVFDRTRQAGAEEFCAGVRERFPDLPITFLFYPPAPGRLVERVNISTFYNSMNTVTALARCRTRWAILHDFDLYPLVPEYFVEVVRAMRERDLRFSGLELTLFDGLCEEDNLIGTWCLGMDVAWLRRTWRPIDCFHKTARVRGRLINLDPYSYIQSRTPERALAGTVDGSSCCHVKNLCSTYLRFRSSKPFSVAWRLHYLWYLESLSGMEGRLAEVERHMDEATDPILAVDGLPVDFSGTDPTCADVLRDELVRMEGSLFGSMRPEVDSYLRSFRVFLERFGSAREQAA